MVRISEGREGLPFPEEQDFITAVLRKTLPNLVKNLSHLTQVKTSAMKCKKLPAICMKNDS